RGRSGPSRAEGWRRGGAGGGGGRGVRCRPWSGFARGGGRGAPDRRDFLAARFLHRSRLGRGFFDRLGAPGGPLGLGARGARRRTGPSGFLLLGRSWTFGRGHPMSLFTLTAAQPNQPNQIPPEGRVAASLHQYRS